MDVDNVRFETEDNEDKSDSTSVPPILVPAIRQRMNAFLFIKKINGINIYIHIEFCPT